MRKIDITVCYTEELLGTASANPALHEEFIASKAPDAETLADEVAAIGVEEAIDKAMTVFPRFTAGEPNALRPFTWGYQWKGFFKESCGMLRRADGFKSKALKAYKKEIDGLVFVAPNKILLEIPEGGRVGSCQRPLRAQTAQGERIALANSETVPAGTTQRFSVTVLKDSLVPLVLEWLSYGYMHGAGQWRNSHKGTFRFKAEENGKGLGGTWDM